jgi:hypothetical protein
MLRLAAFLPFALAAPTDGETVSLMKGTKELGTGTLNGGSASFTTSTLAVGPARVKAGDGDSKLAPSTSKPAEAGSGINRGASWEEPDW